MAIDVPDLAHVDAQALLPAVQKLARTADSRAALTSISFNAETKDGTVDISGHGAIAYQFTTLSVVVQKRMATITKSNPSGGVATVPEPRCSARAAWKAAVGGGLPAGATASFMYSSDTSLGPGWRITGSSKSYRVDGQSCALKSSNR